MKDHNEVAIELPETIFERVEHCLTDRTGAAGWCLLCDRPIKTDSDFIPDTDTHNCERGRRLAHDIPFDKELIGAETASPDPSRDLQDDQAFEMRRPMRHRCRARRSSGRFHD